MNFLSILFLTQQDESDEDDKQQQTQAAKLAKNNEDKEKVPRKGVCFVSTQRLVSAISVSSYEIVEDSLDAAKINNDDEFCESVSLGKEKS